MPNLSKLGVNLSISPLKGNNYDFQLSKKCQKSDSGFDVFYKSTSNDLKFAVHPSFQIKGVKFTGNINYDFRIPDGNICAQYKNFTFRSCYDKNVFCTAGFYAPGKIARIDNFAFGVGAHWSSIRKPKELFVMCKGEFHNCKTSAITTLMKNGSNTFEVELRHECQKAIKNSIIKSGSVVNYNAKGVTYQNGIEVDCHKSKFALAFDSKSKVIVNLECMGAKISALFPELNLMTKNFTDRKSVV